MRTFVKMILVLALGFSFASAEIKVGDQYIFINPKNKTLGIFTIKKKIKNGYMTNTVNIQVDEQGNMGNTLFIIEKYHNTEYHNIYDVKIFVDGRIGASILMKELEDGTLHDGGFRVDTGDFLLSNIPVILSKL